MDTILVVNAGSSSVKFQVFAVDGEGRLRRQIKGQMDGIGSRPRLRASGAGGDPLAERGYSVQGGGGGKSRAKWRGSAAVRACAQAGRAAIRWRTGPIRSRPWRTYRPRCRSRV